MTNANLNIRTEKDIKEKAEKLYAELGLNMSTAINMFLRASIRENGIPFDLKLDNLNKQSQNAIEEGRKIAYDNDYPSYNNMNDLKKALELWFIKLNLPVNLKKI